MLVCSSFIPPGLKPEESFQGHINFSLNVCTSCSCSLVTSSLPLGKAVCGEVGVQSSVCTGMSTGITGLIKNAQQFVIVFFFFKFKGDGLGVTVASKFKPDVTAANPKHSC